MPAGSSVCFACYLLPQVSQRRLRGRPGVSGRFWRGEFLLAGFWKAGRFFTPHEKRVSRLAALRSASAGPAPGGERWLPPASAPSWVAAPARGSRVAAASRGRRGSPPGCEGGSTSRASAASQEPENGKLLTALVSPVRCESELSLYKKIPP